MYIFLKNICYNSTIDFIHSCVIIKVSNKSGCNPYIDCNTPVKQLSRANLTICFFHAQNSHNFHKVIFLVRFLCFFCAIFKQDLSYQRFKPFYQSSIFSLCHFVPFSSKNHNAYISTFSGVL